MKSTRDEAISQASTSAPSTASGTTIGAYATVPTISSTIAPTARAGSPFESCANFGRKGAPAAQPMRTTAVAAACSIGSTRDATMAATGTTTKFAASSSSTMRTSRSGSTILATVRPSPMAAIEATTKTSMPT